ncbi:hypothetical protein KR009_012107 [Drosophila setifemur]|nr:hypothetical protein KR009_012107 [Drosophila setifemur]
MLHNNAPWLPPHQQQQQQQPQQHPNPPQQQQQQHPNPAQQQQHPNPPQQQQVYASQMFQQQQQQPNYWPEEQQQQQQQLNYNNYFAGQQQPQIPQQPQIQQQQQQQPPPPPQQLFYPTPSPHQQEAAPLEAFDNNNSSRNDGWGDWGDWNETSNNSNTNNSTNNIITNNNNNPGGEALMEPMLEDAFTAQSSPSSWPAFANNNNNNVELPPPADQHRQNLQQQQPPQAPLLLHPQHHQQQLNSPPELGQEAPELDAIVPPMAFQNQPALGGGLPLAGLGAPPAAPPSSVAPPAALPPSIASQSAGNPFKRSGTGLSKRVNILAGPAGGASPSPVQPGAGQMPPQPVGPPQAEAQSEGFNVLAMPVPLAAPTLTAPPSFYAPPPLEPDNQEVLSAPNDERAQYLQTSHLSEQLDFEADQDAGQLPPPGLSRLVLGQQELESQQQRLVTGATEQPTQPQAALHMEERLADGEDTSEGEQMPARHRVVTGVETSAPDPVVSLSLREQREVVMDGENLEDGDETLPSVGLPEMSLSSQSHPDEPESMPAIVEANPHQQSQLQQQQQQQQPLQQQQVLQLEKKRSAQVTRRGNTSLDLESDESDEFLQSERERDRERERERDRRVLMEDRRGGRGRSLGHNYTYDGETEDSVRGAPTHHETKSLRETQHHRRNHDSNRSNRRHHETDVDWERDRERERERDREMGRDRGDRDRERDRDRNWRRRSNNKYHSGGEDQDQRSYEHSSRRYNNSNYDGESDNPDLNHLGGEADLDGSTGTGAGGAGGSAGGRSSKTGRQDYDDYERERERDRNYTRRSNKQSSSGDKHWDGYEEYRRKSSRNSDLEKERTNGNTSAAAVAASTGAGGSGSGSGKRRNYDQYGVSGTYDPYGMYEQMSRNPHAYADMYAKFYGQMINSMAAVSAAAASKATVPVATGISGMLAGAQIPGAVIAGGASSEAALQRERERAATEAAPSTYGGSSQTAAGGAVITSSGVVSRPPRRRTPLMFNRPHLVASYAMSLLLRVKPKYAGRGRLRNDVEVAPLRIRDGTSSLLRMYPGPLQGRKLHKDKIISFCKEQIRLGPTRGCTVLYATQKKPQGSVDKYRASHALMWHLLILLLRQNGYIADTDVGDLLLENQQEYPYNPSEFEAEAEPDAEAESEADRDQNVGQEENSDGDSAEAAAEEESTVAAAAGAATSSGAPKGDSPLSEQAATDKFRSYVLRGNVEEALQWATDNSLWTHAFFLALYEDRYALTDVAHKFLSRAIKGNDPLQTLYQMKSCQTPACVSQLRDERWGDWRSHLSILVTNKSRQPEYDRSSVVALGDTLFQRGDIYAAHFCYLVAQEEFGRYDSSATEQTTLTANVPRLILLGASHYKKFSEFASNEAIIMTEIYEYARSLSDPKFSIATFQHYKFLLATRILDYGQHFRCTNYLEQIARHIELKPEAYDRDFVQRVCGLAERLRYHDPILINRVSFASPPNATNNKDSAAPEEKAWLRQLRSLADVPQPVEQKQEQLQQQQQDINQQFAEVNKQFKELNMQYDGANLEHTLQANTNQDAQAQAQAQVQDHYAQQQQQQQQPLYYDPNATQTQYEATPNEQATEAGGAPPPPVPAPAVPAYGYGYMQNDADNDLSTRSTFDESHQQHEFQSDPAVNEGYAAPVPVPAAAAPGYGYDYWSGTQQPPYGDELQTQQRPAISMPKSKSYEDEDDGGAGRSAAGGAAHPGQKSSSDPSAGGKQAGKQAGGDLGAPGNQNAGWFGGLWNKLSLKPKNQMILPDDKNPTIVWDKERKCWTNTEGGSEEVESFKPPPKMSDLGMGMGMPPGAPSPLLQAPFMDHQQQQQQQQQHQQIPPLQQIPPFQQIHQPLQQPQMYGGGGGVGVGVGGPIDYTAAPAPELHPSVPSPAPLPAPSPAPAQAQAPLATPAPGPAASATATAPGGAQPKLQSNMFKMQRNRTLKNSYVDVFNPSGAPMSAAADNVLAPMMAPAAVPQGGYFVPGAAPTHQQ